MTNAIGNPLDLTGRRYLVTGASSGIGRATAVLLGSLGAQVICSGRNRQRLEELLRELPAGDHACEDFDLLETMAIRDWVVELAAKYGPVNGLIHAAGLQSPMPVSRIKSNQWEKMRSANLDSFVELVRGFCKEGVVADQHGRIVVISTVLATCGSPGRSAYAATKGAIEGMVPSLALELVDRKVCVNAIAPAFVKTPMYDDIARFWNEEQRAAVLTRHPLGFGEPEDVAGAVAFLLADTGRWITGTVLRVDGGYAAA